jgi:hypothetical protein
MAVLPGRSARHSTVPVSGSTPATLAPVNCTYCRLPATVATIGEL